MNKTSSCKSFGSCYAEHNWFFIVTSSIFILLFIVTVIVAYNPSITKEDKLIAQYVVASLDVK